MKNRLWLLLPLAFLAGCAENSPQGSAVYSPALSPTSDHQQNRVYGTADKASAQDIQLGEEVRQLLMQNKKLAPPPSNVIATAHDGVVTLTGRVPTTRTKQEIHQQIAQLPGVTRVDDNLEVRWGR